jgi:hypothetical protein
MWPEFVDKGKYSKMPKLSVQAQMEEFFYRELVKYLMLAEEKRRWNVFKDIHWDAANPESSETLAQCVETFCAVEMYLPDFHVEDAEHDSTQPGPRLVPRQLGL